MGCRALHLADLITEMNGTLANFCCCYLSGSQPVQSSCAKLHGPCADFIPRTGFCGFMSILTAMRYCSGAPEELSKMWLALGFMPFGLFFDFMDGKVARWRHKSSLMGQELDSLADLVRLLSLAWLAHLIQSHLYYQLRITANAVINSRSPSALLPQLQPLPLAYALLSIHSSYLSSFSAP